MIQLPPFKVITNLSDFPKFNSDPVFCDIETQGLYTNPRTIQMYQPTTDDTIYILDMAPMGYNKLTYPQVVEASKELLKPLHTVWYNSSYDLGTLNLVTEKIDDLYYAVKTAYCQMMEFSLDKVTTKLYGNLYGNIEKKEKQSKGFVLGAYLSNAQLVYSATDVYGLSLLWKEEKIQKVIANNLAYKVDMLSQRYAVQYQQNGMIVNLDKRNEFLKEAILNVAECKAQFPDGFNPNSYLQVRKYLDTEDSDHEALVKYAMSDRILASQAKLIMDYKRSLKEISYLESINFPKMYTKFNVAGAITGRFTAKGGDLIDAFNSQQIPKRFQKLFKDDAVVDGVETCVVGLDYSTLELRLACAIYNEPAMYKQLMDGEDLHTSMAMLCSGKKLHPDGLLGSEYVHQSDTLSLHGQEFLSVLDRTTAKSINFGYVFGMSAATYQNYAYVSYGVELSLEESVALRDKYFAKYPNFKAYHANVWNEYKKPTFYYETALGRRAKPKLGTDGINGPVQGSGAETTKLAVHYLIQEYPEAINYIFNVVHDAIYLRVPKVDKDLWNERLKTAMQKGWTEISKCPIMKFKDIPMPVGA